MILPMVSAQRALKVTLFALLLSLPATELSATEEPAVRVTNTSHQLKNWLTLFRPPNPGVPANTGNGSSRDDLRCAADDPLMQPLLPEVHYGLTTEERPGIFVEIPETSAQKALLVFHREENDFYQEAFLDIDSTKNIVGFRLPDATPALEPDQTYRWSLTFICGDYFTLNDPTITGWVHRQPLPTTVQQALDTQSPVDAVRWLGSNGYWYDMAQQLVSSPNLLD